MTTRVVYVHGLWLNGWESVLLRRRLSRQMRCETSVFSYSSVSADVAANARALVEFLERISADTLHLVAHSLGGLVVSRAIRERAVGRREIAERQGIAARANRVSGIAGARQQCRAAIWRACRSADPSWG